MGLDFLKGKKYFTSFLVTVQDTTETYKRIVDGKSFSIGRSPDCTMPFPEPSMSRVHVIFHVKDGHVMMTDQGSANGTFINNTKVEPKKTIQIESNDVIKLGSTEIRLKVEVFEKLFNEKDIANSLLPEVEKEALKEMIKGANQQANRVSLLAQEHNDKLARGMEERLAKFDLDTKVLADDIKKSGEIRAAEFLQEARAKGDALSLESKKTSTILAETIIKDAEKKAEDIVQMNIKFGLKATKDSIAQAEKDAEKIKADYMLKAEAELKVNHAGLLDEIERRHGEINTLRNTKDNELSKEMDKKRAALEDALLDIQKEVDRLAQQKDLDVKKKQSELTLLASQHELELKRQIEIKEDEIKVRVEESEFQLAKQAKEIAHLKELKIIEIQKKEHEFEQIYKTHLHELEKTEQSREKEMRLRVDSELKQKKIETHELEVVAQSLKVQIEEIERKKVIALGQLDEKKSFITDLSAKISKTEKEHEGAILIFEKANERKHKIEGEAVQLEKRAANLQLKIEEDKGKIKELSRSYDLKIQEQKISLVDNFENLKKDREKQFQESLLLDIEKNNQLREIMLREMQAKQNAISHDVHSKVLKTALAYITKVELAKFSDDLLPQIEAAFVENLSNISTSTHMTNYNSPEIAQSQKKRRLRFIGLAIATGLLGSFAFNLAYDQTQKRSMASILEEQKIQRARELEERKFEPAQDAEVRDTYTDSIIYTKNFVSLYRDSEIQSRWVKEASNYFFNSWRIPEETTIEILSKEKTLVQELSDKRNNINPDFVEQNIKKMRESEVDSVAFMKDKLGTNVKFEAFKKFEKKFFMNEIAKRQPAEVYVDPNLEESGK